MAEGTCAPLQGKSTTGFATCLPSERDVSTGPSHHPVLFFPCAESSSKSLSTPLPILLPIIHTPSDHPLSHSGWPVASGFHTLPESSSGKLSQSPFLSPLYEATVNLCPSATHSLVPGSVNTASQPLIPNSNVSKSHSSSHAGGVLPSNAPNKPFRPSQISPTYRTATPMSSWVPESYQTVLFTVTTTVPETPQSTSPTPSASTTDATGGQPAVSIPSSTTTMGPTTPVGWVVASTSNVATNPMQGASLSSTGQGFFGNHPAVVFVFLVSGVVIAGMVALALLYCCRLRGQTQPRRRRLEDISPPLLQSPSTMREDAKSHGVSSDHTAPLQSFINVPVNRSGENLPTSHSDIYTPLPPPVMQRERRKSSYRVPVRYTGLGAHQNNSRATDWKYTGPYSDYLPTQVAQTQPSPNDPPPLPTRSPLRVLASLNQEDPKRLSRTSSPSLYPPSESISTSEPAMASENIPGVNQGTKKAGNLNQSPGLSSVGSVGAYSAWRSRHSPLGNPASVTGPAQTSLLAQVSRMSHYGAARGIGRDSMYTQ